jgi:hypothetical protein
MKKNDYLKYVKEISTYLKQVSDSIIKRKESIDSTGFKVEKSLDEFIKDDLKVFDIDKGLKYFINKGPIIQLDVYLELKNLYYMFIAYTRSTNEYDLKWDDYFTQQSITENTLNKIVLDMNNIVMNLSKFSEKRFKEIGE